MTRFFTDPTRADEPNALPDAETFRVGRSRAAEFLEQHTDKSWNETPGDNDIEDAIGWYWWPCFPGCLPDGEPMGPFATEQEAIDDAQSDAISLAIDEMTNIAEADLD